MSEHPALPMFYVEAVFFACPRCGQSATHRVMRRGKTDYGLYCERHAGLKAAELNDNEWASDRERA